MLSKKRYNKMVLTAVTVLLSALFISCGPLADYLFNIVYQIVIISWSHFLILWTHFERWKFVCF
jgi:hypothetical protein